MVLKISLIELQKIFQFMKINKRLVKENDKIVIKIKR